MFSGAPNPDVLKKIQEMQKEVLRMQSALKTLELRAQGGSSIMLPLAPVQGWLLSMMESYMVLSKLTSPFYRNEVQKMRSFIDQQDLKINVMPAVGRVAKAIVGTTGDLAKAAVSPFR